MSETQINQLRHFSRKLVRELGMLQLNQAQSGKTPQHWHALIEISKDPDITVSKLGQLLLLSISAMSRIVDMLTLKGYVVAKDGMDKREKCLNITAKGQKELEYIDTFSNEKIKGAFEFLTSEEQELIITAIHKYSGALEKSRLMREQVKVLTLSTARPIRKQIINMIEHIQMAEYSLPITDEINYGILKAEDEYYYNKSYNFWYAIDPEGIVIGSIGLKMIDAKTAEVKKLFVSQSYRGKGVAQKLMRSLLKAASKHRFENLYLGTVDLLKAAHRFYDKSGFVLIAQSELPAEFEICPLDTVFYEGKVVDLLMALPINSTR